MEAATTNSLVRQMIVAYSPLRAYYSYDAQKHTKQRQRGIHSRILSWPLQSTVSSSN